MIDWLLTNNTSILFFASCTAKRKQTLQIISCVSPPIKLEANKSLRGAEEKMADTSLEMSVLHVAMGNVRPFVQRRMPNFHGKWFRNVCARCCGKSVGKQCSHEHWTAALTRGKEEDTLARHTFICIDANNCRNWLLCFRAQSISLLRTDKQSINSLKQYESNRNRY